ncbi:MAG: ABC transporter permease [Leptolyngbya sp. SIOISBB]|nr:ABC transporter permease [Leptolyngbya sp. SIOISBB]
MVNPTLSPTARSPQKSATDWSRVTFNAALRLGAYTALVLLTAPTIIILIASFSSGETLQFPPDGLSIKWYIALRELPELWAAAWNSLWVATVTTLTCIALGFAAALVISERRTPLTQSLEALFMSPLAMPALSVGLALLVFFNFIGWRVSVTTLIISHIVVGVPYLVRTILVSLSQMSSSFRDASASLGAGSWYTFRHVTFPLARQGVIAGSFITFLTSFDNITVSLFVSDARTQVLPVRMWTLVQNNLDVRAASIAGFLVFVTAILMLAMERFVNLSRFVVSDR